MDECKPLPMACVTSLNDAIIAPALDSSRYLALCVLLT